MEERPTRFFLLFNKYILIVTFAVVVLNYCDFCQFSGSRITFDVTEPLTHSLTIFSAYHHLCYF